jgi:hypothetical protein
LRTFIAADVRYLIVGAYALALHGRPRATGDLDVWVEPSPDNAPRVMRALVQFGAPLTDVSEEDFAREGIVFQIGVPPARIDLTQLTGLTFAEAWPGRVRSRFGDVDAAFIGLDAFIRNKRATGRAPRTSAPSRVFRENDWSAKRPSLTSFSAPHTRLFGRGRGC